MLGLISRHSATTLQGICLSPTRIWNGRLKWSQIRAIQKIQMRATEMIEGMSYIDYSERLKLFRLPTLSYRGLEER